MPWAQRKECDVIMISDNFTKKSLAMKYPPITLYPYIANKLSVLLNYEETLPWFHSNFIQMWASKNGPKGYWSDFLYYGRNRFCPNYKFSLISKKVMQYKWNSIIDFIIDSIDLGYYVYMNINNFYIPAYQHFNKNHRRHDIFVYGYDKKSKTLNIADFFQNGKYSYSYVSFNDFEQAYINYDRTNENDFLGGMSLETFENTIYKFNIDFVVDSIKDYLLSRNTSIASDLEELDNKDDIVFGIQVYDILSEYSYKLGRGVFDFVDIRPFHMLFDHKVAMLLRLKYLEESRYLDKSEYIINFYNMLQSECLILRNMIIKYNLTNDIKIFDRAAKKLEIISDMERKALNVLLNSIH